MAARKKPIQKTVMFDPEVYEAMEKQMKASHNANFSAVVNDGLRYALFPEFRNDRDADLVKLYNQFSASLASHRKKTARDMAFMQEMLLRFMFEFYQHNNEIPDDAKPMKEAQATMRVDGFMEEIIRGMSSLKPLSDREEGV